MFIPLGPVSASYSREYPYWIEIVSGNGNTTGRLITTDIEGNMYLIGSTYYGTEILFIVYNKSGDVLHKRRVTGGSNINFISGVALDGLGNIYISGTKNGNSGGGYRPVIYKLGTDGTYKWAKTVYTSPGSYEYGTGIAVDSVGSPYLHIQGNSNTGTTIKYDTSGDIQWQKTTDSCGYDFKGGLAIDNSDNVIIASGDIGSQKASIITVDSSGQLVEKLVLNHTTGNQFSEASGIKIDSSGSRYITTTRFVDVGGGDYQYSLITAKYSSGSGSASWVKALGLPGRYLYTYQGALDLDSEGNIYSLSYTATGTPSYSVLAKYDTDGQLLWKRTISSSGNNLRALALNASTDGVVYITGYVTYAGTNRMLNMGVPIDGTKTGTYSVGDVAISYSDATSVTTPTMTYGATGPQSATISTSSLSASEELYATSYGPSSAPTSRPRLDL